MKSAVSGKHTGPVRKRAPLRHVFQPLLERRRHGVDVSNSDPFQLFLCQRQQRAPLLRNAHHAGSVADFVMSYPVTMETDGFNGGVAKWL